MKPSTLTICIKYGLITRTNDSFTVSPTTDKYSAAREIAITEGLTHTAAMRRVNSLIDRVKAGLDPEKDNRGGKREGSGRKRIKSIPS